MKPSPEIKQQIHRRLLTWFEYWKRPMPWRGTSDPYKIWISEIMLQQTQVATVESYYIRFMERFPSLQELADADIHQVMKAWEGLGYYSRARNLHRAAQEIQIRFNGRFPDNLMDLLSLPGVGRYTAGAILSIAFGKPAPILDGNVIRLFARLFHLTDNVDNSSTQKILWSLAEALIPQAEIRPFNEAMMELGALICRPRKPVCSECPLISLCEAYALNIQEYLPVKSPKKPVPHYDVTAGIIRKDGRFLITLRPLKGLLGGLWEFPGGKLEAGETLEQCLHREISEELNLLVDVQDHLISVKHAYTHFKITLHVFECRVRGGDIQLDPEAAMDHRWITANELDDYAFPGADRKVITVIKQQAGFVDK